MNDVIRDHLDGETLVEEVKWPRGGLAEGRHVATAVLAALDAYIEAMNGKGHPGKPHDRTLHYSAGGRDFEVFDEVGDCAACGGAQYGTEDTLTHAHIALRDWAGQERKPWEQHYPTGDDLRAYLRTALGEDVR